MSEELKKNLEPVVPLGTQIVTRVDTHTPEGDLLQTAGAAAVVLQTPTETCGDYRVRFPSATNPHCSARSSTCEKNWRNLSGRLRQPQRRTCINL